MCRWPLSSIFELYETFLYGFEGDDPMCRSVALHASLMEEVDLSRPIILSSDDRVTNGTHRVFRTHVLGLGTIPAVRFVSDPLPDHTAAAGR